MVRGAGSLRPACSLRSMLDGRLSDMVQLLAHRSIWTAHDHKLHTGKVMLCKIVHLEVLSPLGSKLRD